MDPRRFDALSRALSEAGTRRGLLGLLTALPVLGGLFALLDLDEANAKGRRKRRKKRHKHGKGRRRKHHKKCRADSKAKTCSGKCGPVINNCKKTVDCGSCACTPACDECFTCQEGPNTPGTCVSDPEQVGDPCGSDGQVCQADGSCACQAGSCPDSAPICQLGACVPCTTNTQCQIAALGDRCCLVSGTCEDCCASGDCSSTTPICDDGTCVACSAEHPCPDGCCDASGSCQDGDTTTACGDIGQPCITCVVTGEVCTAGDCVCPSGVICTASGCCPNNTDVCDANVQCCTPTTCAAQGKNCGTIDDSCDGTLTCGSCTPGSTTPLCINNVCTACSVENPCPSGCCASDGRCHAGTSDNACGPNGGACDDCDAVEECSARVCVPRACGEGGVCLVFATSTWQSGDLNGLEGADDICQDLADAAELPGTYKAWLSDDTGSPSTRIVQSTGPYRRVDGVTVASSWSDLIDGALLAPIDKTEMGAQVPGDSNRFVWTNTTPSGTLINSANDCENWTSSVGGPIGGFLGVTTSTGAHWTQFNSSSCVGPGRLYCFQQS